MAVETDDDRLYMLNDFGVSVTYTPYGGSSVTITGIFDTAYREVNGGEVDFALYQPELLCRTSDVSNAAEGDTVAYGGTTYTVVVVAADGTGLTTLILEAQ